MFLRDLRDIFNDHLIPWTLTGIVSPYWNHSNRHFGVDPI